MEQKEWNKIAKEYHDYVISPFQEGVINPLLSRLKTIVHSDSKVIGDIGCGRGEILDILASKFKQVYAMDFSPEMIKIAKGNNKASNIKYFVKDMRKLEGFKEKFDVAISVNSVLMPKIKDVKKALSSIYETIKPDGVFFGIFPSMDSILYQGFLIFEGQLKIEKNEKKAISKTKRIMEKSKYNFINGTYTDDNQTQKFYYDFELKTRLKDAGFKNIKLSKVLYPWGKATGDFEDFPGKPKMWDWFVSAEK